MTSPPVGEAIKVRVGFARSANAVFQTLPKKVRTGLLQKIKTVALNPKLGKPLIGEFHRCVRVTYGRLRSVVLLGAHGAAAVVVTIGPRKSGSRDDAYEVAMAYLAQHPDEIETILRHMQAYVEAEERSRKPKGG